MPANSTILELGAGYCDFINGINAKRKIAVDVIPDSKMYCNSDIEFICCNVLEISLVAESVDVVFASNFLEHFNDTELNLLFQNLTKIIKPSGKLILMQPNYFYAYREYWDDYTHKKAFSHFSICDFLQNNGFIIQKLYKRFIPFSFYSNLPKSYWLTKFYLMLPYKFFAKQMCVIALKK
ncbi:MAG: hypothetical protein A3G23_04170 [Bacteroidetes bacterium RIFCSPLOWO2_12_FULL_37_12]|nr:MAG: hypothetical protein A3G23_04170 [Bacteroidetes bacterium RIFCSPLOWO2_12_FULL_37_12]